MFARRPLFIFGIAAFVVASIGAGSCQTTFELIACRLAQGACAAIILPTTLAFLASVFAEGRERQLAYGMWATAGSAGGLVGLLLGGLITSAFGWRWIFFINGPLAVLAIGAALAVVIYGLGEAQSVGWGSL